MAYCISNEIIFLADNFLGDYKVDIQGELQ